MAQASCRLCLPFQFDVDEALFAMWQALFFVLRYSFSQMVFFSPLLRVSNLNQMMLCSLVANF